MQVDSKMPDTDTELGLLVTGHPDGHVCFWRDKWMVSSLRVHDMPPGRAPSSMGNPTELIRSIGE